MSQHMCRHHASDAERTEKCNAFKAVSRILAHCTEHCMHTPTWTNRAQGALRQSASECSDALYDSSIRVVLNMINGFSNLNRSTFRVQSLGSLGQQVQSLQGSERVRFAVKGERSCLHRPPLLDARLWLFGQGGGGPKVPKVGLQHPPTASIRNPKLETLNPKPTPIVFWYPYQEPRLGGV